ncbi:hypothetical protein GGR56DRAFT_629023 [Xylariaceae sp. FL0804]|nr:hypothetical protein GGR56DRAFT_629023 [Xylariaceae sp. FL0804]
MTPEFYVSGSGAMSSAQATLSATSLSSSTSPSGSLVSQASEDDSKPPNPAGTENSAAGASLLLDAVNNVRQIIRLIQCPVCSGILFEPTTLPCGYSICKSCVPESHLRSNISWPATTSRLQGFQCPFEDCGKEHATADCAIDVTLKKALITIRETLESARDVECLADAATHIEVQDYWTVAGVSSMEEKMVESQVLKGGRLVATYTMVQSGKLGYTYEVAYSTVDASDNEVETTDVALFNKLKESARGEMDCQVCYAIFLDPMTTTCGHTFCRTCLHRILEHSNLCPLCRRELSIQARVDQRAFPSNERLCKVINGFWADLVALRAQAHRLEQQANYGGFDIPVFVCTLSFPHMPLFLHVFEPRYRLMIRRAMEADRTFGMVMGRPAASSGEPHFMELGTLQRIVSIEYFPDGRSLLETVGVSRFRVTRHGWLDGYVVANIEKIDDISVAEEEALEASETMRDGGTQIPDLAGTESGSPPQPVQQPAPSPNAPISLDDLEAMSTRELVNFGVDFVTRMRAQSVAWLTARVLAIYGDCPSDPCLFPWWFASILPVKDREKYLLISTSSVRERLKVCCRWIVEWETSRWTISDCLVL